MQPPIRESVHGKPVFPWAPAYTVQAGGFVEGDVTTVGNQIGNQICYAKAGG